MAKDKVLVDSSYLFALFEEEDEGHKKALNFSDFFRGDFIVPYVVLTEVAFLFKRRGGVPSLASFIDRFVEMNPTL